MAREIKLGDRLVGDAHQKAQDILLQYRDRLDAVAARLLEVETVSREEFESIFPPPIPKNSGTPIPMAV